MSFPLCFEESSTAAQLNDVRFVCALACRRLGVIPGLDVGSKDGDGGAPLAVSPTSTSAGPKSESALGMERHHAAAKALTSTKVQRAALHLSECRGEIMYMPILSYSSGRRDLPAESIFDVAGAHLKFETPTSRAGRASVGTTTVAVAVVLVCVFEQQERFSIFSC